MRMWQKIGEEADVKMNQTPKSMMLHVRSLPNLFAMKNKDAGNYLCSSTLACFFLARDIIIILPIYLYLYSCFKV